MDNPWVNIPKRTPYVLPQDHFHIQEFNKSAKEEHKIYLDVLPQPFAGNLKTAEVVLLNGNPGYSELDKFYEKSLPSFRQANLNALTFKNKAGFFFLDERFSATPAYKWWSQRLKEVLKIWGTQVSHKLMVIEWFPYHSISFKPLPKGLILSSQQYSFYLVREAIKTNKRIILMRKDKYWLDSVPELTDYCSLINKNNVCISRNNMPAGKFDEIFITC